MFNILYILIVIGFLISFVMLELWLIKKSKEKFLELKEAYKNLKEAEKILKEII